MLNQRELDNSQQDVKMGNAESSQSADVGAIAGLANPSAFHHQSPNVARLIQSDTSSKMEYEFPISDVPSTSSAHHHQGPLGPNNHSILPSNASRQGHSSSYHPTSPTSNHSSHLIRNNEQKSQRSKLSSNSPSNLCFSLTSCFGCRTGGSNSSSMNPLRDKVHAIRIVRASNDLTPAVFDSHYNIITLEQLRECDNNTSGNATNSASNDYSDPSASQNASAGATAQNGNGSAASTAASAVAAAAKKDNTQRLKKKKKKRPASRPAGSDDDDDDDRPGRT